MSIPNETEISSTFITVNKPGEEPKTHRVSFFTGSRAVDVVTMVTNDPLDEITVEKNGVMVDLRAEIDSGDDIIVTRRPGRKGKLSGRKLGELLESSYSLSAQSRIAADMNELEFQTTERDS
ncbi:hypothetical protein HZC07_04230 [Candidatus Micrarchaeota archaeon]|nr:hypothetical protein [Candidatus Micrarchaeota archaeon]